MRVNVFVRIIIAKWFETLILKIKMTPIERFNLILHGITGPGLCNLILNIWRKTKNILILSFNVVNLFLPSVALSTLG